MNKIGFECYEAETEQQTSSGEKVKVWVCYCGTSACTKRFNKDYLLPKDFDALSDEDRFYKKVFKNSII